MAGIIFIPLTEKHDEVTRLVSSCSEQEDVFGFFFPQPDFLSFPSASFSNPPPQPLHPLLDSSRSVGKEKPSDPNHETHLTSGGAGEHQQPGKNKNLSNYFSSRHWTVDYDKRFCVERTNQIEKKKFQDKMCFLMFACLPVYLFIWFIYYLEVAL